MVSFLIRRPIAVLMTFLAIVILGIIASFQVPVSLMPDIQIPEISILVDESEISAEELENAYVSTLRMHLSQVAHLSDMESTTRNGSAKIVLQFEYGTDIDMAFIEVNDKLDAAMVFLPREFNRPRVVKANVSDIPAFYLSVSYKQNKVSQSQFLELSDFTEMVVKKRLEQLDEVALADITGLSKPEILIIPDYQKIDALGISTSFLKQVIAENNITLGNIKIKKGHYQYSIKLNKRIQSVHDLENISLNHHGKLFKLGELAEFNMQSAEVSGIFKQDSVRAISMAIIKQGNSRMMDLKKSVSNVANEFQQLYPDIDISISRDQTKILDFSINNLKQSLALGASLAILIMFFFLKDFRSPILIGISIPVSVIISILFFYLIGLPLNIVSLSGLILGVGMMIDNSIIVIDNIYQKLENKETVFNSSVIGTNEVIRPLISSVLTTCAVFLPLITLSGISGAMFYDQALAVSIGLLVSLIVSITLLPTLFALIYRKNVHIKTSAPYMVRLTEKWYAKWIDVVLKKKSILFTVIILFIALAALIYGFLDKSKMPQLPQTETLLRIDWNENISLEENIHRIDAMYSHIQPSGYLAHIGHQHYFMNHYKETDISEASIYINTETSHKLNALTNKAQAYLSQNYPDAIFRFQAPGNIFEKIFREDQPLAVMKVGIENTDNKTISAVEKTLTELSKKQHTTFSNPAKAEYIEVYPDFEKLQLYKIDYHVFLSRLRSVISKDEATELQANNRFISVVFSEKQEKLNDILHKTYVKNVDDVEFPLSAFLSYNKQEHIKYITGGKTGLYIPVEIHDEALLNSNGINELKSAFNEKGLYNIEFGGKYFEGKQLVREMILVLLISLSLLYFILAAQFESLKLPLIVLLEVPIDLFGSFLFLLLFGEGLNLMSMIGIIVMSGIIINDSILKIDTINRLYKEGMGLLDAIHEGGKRRLKPILMTSLTTILALLPFLFSNDLGSQLQKPLALAVIGGMLIGTLVSLFFIPLMYWVLKRGKN